MKRRRTMVGIDTGPMMKSKTKIKYNEKEDDNKKGKKKGLAMILARLREKKK